MLIEIVKYQWERKEPESLGCALNNWQISTIASQSITHLFEKILGKYWVVIIIIMTLKIRTVGF